MVGRKLCLTVVGCSLAFLPGASPDRYFSFSKPQAQAKVANKSLYSSIIACNNCSRDIEAYHLPILLLALPLTLPLWSNSAHLRAIDLHL
jgi:hypothetical protein